MLFYLWRILLGGILSAVSIKEILKSNIVHKKLFYISTVSACVLVMTITAMFPVENLFVRFNTPEAAFRYASVGNIEEVLHGQSSSLVIYKTDKHTYSRTVILKSSNSYKLPTYFTLKRISQKFNAYGVFSTYHVYGTQDYYILATIPHRNDNETIEVYNSDGTVVESSVVEIKNSYRLYFYLQDFTKGHYIILNGETIPLG